MLIYISKTLLFILITIYTHVSFSAQPSKFHYVIGGQLHNEIQSAHILETSMSAKEVACGINVHVTFLCRLEMEKSMFNFSTCSIFRPAAGNIFLLLICDEI